MKERLVGFVIGLLIMTVVLLVVGIIIAGCVWIATALIQDPKLGQLIGWISAVVIIFGIRCIIIGSDSIDIF